MLSLEVAELKKKLREMQELVFRDELTGVLNRRGFLEEANLVLSIRKRHEAAVIFVDLDDFKPINDMYGHEAGDVLLQKIAIFLQAQVRAEDLVARMGGDEFAIFLVDTDLHGGIRVAKKIKKALKKYRFGINDKQIAVHASFGVSSTTEGAKDLRKLLRMADKEMYRRKKRKK